MAQSRGYCFTINNPQSNELVWSDKVAYAAWQKEKGEKGTPHLQGYMEFHRAQAFSAIKKLMPTAHIEPRKGTAEQARAYAMKEDTREEGPWEFGTWSKEQGKRNDLAAVVDSVKQGATMRNIAEQHPVQFIKYERGIRSLRNTLSEPRNFKTNVIVRWGKARSGKTRWVFDSYKMEDVWTKPAGEWFDGYDGHKVALFDDFTGGYKYTELLRVLDRYPMTVPVKGGFVNWRPEVIVLTSNRAPQNWYPNIVDKTALLERIEQIVKVGDQEFEGDDFLYTD